MPLDMPPQMPVYQIERAAPAQDQGMFTAIAAASRAVSQRLRMSSEPSPAEKLLPAIDPRSAALTQPDRVALVTAMRSNWRGDLSKESSKLPNSYVGERIAVAIAFAGAREALNQGALDSADASALNCRMVGLAFDRRAGAYLKGGEQAAQAARKSVSVADIDQCRPAIKAAQARSAPPRIVARVAAPGRIDPAARVPVRVDLMARPKVAINPIGSQKVAINPIGSQKAAQPSQRVRLNPGMQMAAAGNSRN